MNALWRSWIADRIGSGGAVAAIYFPILRRRVKREAKISRIRGAGTPRMTQAIVQNSSDPVV